MQIKAIVFDCFGVLTTDGFFAFCDKHLSANSELTEQAIALNKQVDAGLLDWADMVKSVAEMAAVDLVQAFRELGSTAINQSLFEYIASDLKPSYQIGLLSNVGYNWPKDHFSAQQYGLFDEIVLSYQLGQVKPEAIMYETIATKLGLLPEECVLIDDRLEFCTGAEAVGMKAIHFQSNQQAINDLQKVLS